MDPKTEHKSIPQKSPNYPSMSFSDAISKAKILYDKDGKAGAPKKVALEHLGYKVESGASARTLSALKKFDLIADQNGRIVLTQRAFDLLVYPKESERYKAAIKHCALSPKIYSTLWSEYGDGFPSDAALKAELIDRYNFNPNQVEGFLQDFRSTIQFAGLTAREIEPKEEEMLAQQQNDQTEQVGNKRPQPPNSLTTVGAYQRLMNSFPIPLKKQNQAMISFQRMPLEKADLDLLKKWIDLMGENLTEVLAGDSGQAVMKKPGITPEEL